ncbi:MEDS domain-containing protein [Solwaraspora sp. WMMD406]|uniref:MEDS domain-containing protein n=1 Tax=Solwaraspora sp. WMMD406 TaxID=3016095 RepID=UPI002416E274|nr:MEDS domain-containing protein [Solwaraspora sp. WMMD406]MDG4763538.1 MEDS domain-containing protein [Solwaraspora sp. WMMD406]
MAGVGTFDRVRPGDHVCWAFDSDDQQVAELARYIRLGLARREKVCYFTASRSPEELNIELAEQGVPVEPAVAAGQLVITSVADTYLAAGVFDPEAMVDAWDGELAVARAGGWSALRAIGDMAWAATCVPGGEHLAWYEATVNKVFSAGYGSALCLYDRRIFGSDDLHRVYSAHPATAQDDSGGDWRPLLRIRLNTDPVELRLRGEADASNRDALDATLRDLRHRMDSGTDNDHRATLDLTGLRFADVTAGRLLADFIGSAPDRIRLVGCSPQVARLLDLVAGRYRPQVASKGHP